MDSYIRTTGKVLAVHGERNFAVQTPIGKVVRGFVERREPDLVPGVGDRVELQFKHENMSLARIVKIVEQ